MMARAYPVERARWRRSSPWANPMTVESGTTIEVFPSFLEHMLCPALHPGRTVFLDGLRGHKNRTVVDRIEAAGARVVFFAALQSGLPAR